MKARVYVRSGRLEVTFDGIDDAEEARETARLVTGARKIPRVPTHAYHYPLSVETCLRMREAWGGSLQVSKDVSEWYRQAQAERRSQAERATPTHEAKLTILPERYPALYAWLKPDQRVGAEWIANAYRNGGLLADEGGVGKTATIIAGLLERDVQGNILIVCPKVSVRPVWGRHFAKHSDIPCYTARGTRAKREATIAAFRADPSPRKALVVVAEMLRIRATKEKGRIVEVTGAEYPELFDITWSAMILDEAHKLLGSLDVVKGNLAGEGLARLSYTEGLLRICATATPWGKGGRIDSLFGTLHWLWPDEYPSKWAWARRHFEVIEEKVYIRGGRGDTKTVKRIGGLLKGGEKDLYDTLWPRVLRRTMAEVSPEHAGLKNYIEMVCELDGAQAKQYKVFTDNAELPVQGGIITTTGTLDYMTRCRQIANGVVRKDGDTVKYTGESVKIEALMEHLDSIGILDGTGTTKVVVASQYNEFLDVVAERLAAAKVGFYRLDGSTTELRRDKYMDAFQAEGGHLVFLLNSKAGGVSITLDAADEMHQLDEMYPPEANEQLHWRIFRRGRVHQVFYYMYRAEGTIDEEIGFNVAEGTRAQLKVLDGRRGLNVVRDLAKYRPVKTG